MPKLLAEHRSQKTKSCFSLSALCYTQSFQSVVNEGRKYFSRYSSIKLTIALFLLRGNFSIYLTQQQGMTKVKILSKQNYFFFSFVFVTTDMTGPSLS